MQEIFVKFITKYSYLIKAAVYVFLIFLIKVQFLDTTFNIYRNLSEASSELGGMLLAICCLLYVFISIYLVVQAFSEIEKYVKGGKQ